VNYFDLKETEEKNAIALVCRNVLQPRRSLFRGEGFFFISIVEKRKILIMREVEER
jgi:hypothetical protein